MTQKDNGWESFEVVTIYDDPDCPVIIHCAEEDVAETARQASEGMGFSEFALRQFGDMVLALLAARSMK